MLTPEVLFLYVVEAGSFKKAAEQLNIEASTLSRKIAALEARLKAKLLHRSTSNTHPTEVGQLYYDGLRPLITEQQALEDDIFNDINMMKGKLRIGATADFGEKYIVPIICALQEQAPELSIELILSSDIESLTIKNLDVAIRIGALDDSNLFAKFLGVIPRVLVASPLYIKAKGVPIVPEDLVEHNFILYSALQTQKDIEFKDGTKFPHSKIRSKVTVNSLHAINDLLKCGVGINWGPEWLYKEDLKAGNLIQILPLHPVQGFSIHALYTSKTYLPFKTKMFMKLLTEKINAQGYA